MMHKRLLRTLLLPIDLRLESQCVEIMNEYLVQCAGNIPEDQAIWLEDQIDDWDSSGDVPILLREMVEALLKVGIDNLDYSKSISTSYFDAHTELVGNQLFSSELARVSLSHLLLMVRLVNEEKMSCSQITKILDAMNPSIGFSRRSVEAILEKVSIKPLITPENVSDLFEVDKSLATELFGDSTLDECAESVTEIAFRLGYKRNLGKNLSSLFTETEVNRYTPYIQILHYQCLILEYYDHLVKDFYEFSPRGKAAKKLFDSYPEAMVNAGNPFLNNAKSVQQIDFSWAASKKNKEFPGAKALFCILDGLDELGYAARQELALWVRCYIHRLMVIAEPLNEPLPEAIGIDSYITLINNISVQNTLTKGILEQRLVDVLASVKYRKDQGWNSRGIGDSINASNFSKKKLGECDFQNVRQKCAVAYEAHGGLLTQTYLDGHIKTLRKSAQLRINEWKTFSEISEWEVKVIFVAHEFNAEIPENININGVGFSFSFILYNQLIEETIDIVEDRVFNQIFLTPLSSKSTPSSVRAKLKELLN